MKKKMHINCIVFCSNLHWHDDFCSALSPQLKYVCEKAPDPCANGKNIINIMIYNLRKSKFQKDQDRVEILTLPDEHQIKQKHFLIPVAWGDISPGPEGKKAH
jgi:hypothetical protein